MGILDGLFGRKEADGFIPSDALTPIKPDFELNRSKVKVLEVGSTGTEIFGGYLTEEYLDELQGKRAADIYDRMRRSDPKIRMTTSAMKNPIKSANWEVQIKENTPENLLELAEKQKELLEHILFFDLGDKTWTKFLHEALSLVEFGYSLFEKTYKPVLGHPKFGSYNGVKSLGFRSQRTIEKWNLDKAGKLSSVSQYAYGDGQHVVDIPASFLVHFALDMEGSNFEGISILRSCYGPWLRKNNFLKIIAAGVERYAIGIPTLEIPNGQEKSEQYTLALNALRAYVSGKAAYLTRPKGWDLTITQNPFDAEKIRSTVNEENVEIVNAALANFLELGQSGSGSYSLSFDLSDFFLGALEHIAKIICEGLNEHLIKDLVSMNFGTEPLVELKCSGISDKAGEELSKVLLNLKNAGVLTPDNRLEASLRKRFNLPAMEEKKEVVPLPNTGTNVQTTPTPSSVPENTIQDQALNGAQVTSLIEIVVKFKEGVLDRDSAIATILAAFPTISEERAGKIVGQPLEKPVLNIEETAKPAAVPAGKEVALSEETTEEESLEKDPVVLVIDNGAQKLRETIKSGLKEISQGMKDILIEQWKKGGSEKFKTPDLSSAVGQKTYQEKLQEGLTELYNEGQAQAVEELPGAKVIKLAEDPKRIALARINADVMNLSSAQINDLIKTLTLTYGQNLEAAQSEEEIIAVLDEAVQKFIDGPVSTVGADIQSAKAVNDSRRDFFKENSEKVISYTWINGDPVSDICQFLDGKTLPADHPDVERYWPPLHHNCKTYVVANTEETTENPDPLSSFDVPEDIAASMTLSDLRGKKLTRVRTRRRIRS